MFRPVPICVACLALSVVFLERAEAQVAHNVQILGNTWSGIDSAGGQPIRFIAVKFWGNHDYNTYRDAFFKGVQLYKNSNLTAQTSNSGHNQNWSLQGRKVVLGYYNFATDQYYWVGVNVFNQTASRYITSSNKIGSGSKFHHRYVNSNGRPIVIAFADNDQGGILFRFDDN